MFTFSLITDVKMLSLTPCRCESSLCVCHRIIPRSNCCWCVSPSLSVQMLYSCFILQGRGEGVSLQGAAATPSCCSPEPPDTSAELGASKSGAGSPCAHPAQVTRQLLLLSLFSSPLCLKACPCSRSSAACCSSSRRLAFNSAHR